MREFRHIRRVVQLGRGTRDGSDGGAALPERHPVFSEVTLAESQERLAGHEPNRRIDSGSAPKGFEGPAAGPTGLVRR
jgi:hypothetical protein